MTSPLAAIPFLHGTNGVAFQYFFCVSLGLATVVLSLVAMAFRLQRDEHVEGPAKPAGVDTALELQPRTASNNDTKDKDSLPVATSTPDDAHNAPLDLMPITSHPEGLEAHPLPVPAETQSAFYKLKAVVKQPKVLLLAFFTLIYVGCEVSVGGWTSTFLLEVRDQKTDANALVSGFWAGIAFGRILLIPVTAWMGDELASIVYLLLATGLQLLVWFVPNIVANAVALALLGVCLGPAFPLMITVCQRTIRPRAHLTAAISFISSFAAAGMALLPFMVGLASQTAPQGIKILPPMLVAMLGIQVLLWAAANKDHFVTRVVKRQSVDRDQQDLDRLD